MKQIKNLLNTVMILMIKGYQILVSPMLPKTCRHTPTCSEYAIESIRALGPFRGLVKATMRILRCNPFGSSGYDPVIKKK